MENLGQYLRSCREEQNISIDTASKELRFTPDQITSIENNQLSKLGNFGFSRALVYSYCRFLSADDKIVMNLFDIQFPPPEQAGFIPKKPIREKKLLISTNFLWLVTIIIIIIILGSIIWIAYSKGYLKRPFDALQKNQDSVKVEKPVRQNIEKPDTLRQRMLQITSAPVRLKPVAENRLYQNGVKNKRTSIDTTDYINELLFNTDESPFNPKF